VIREMLPSIKTYGGWHGLRARATLARRGVAALLSLSLLTGCAPDTPLENAAGSPEALVESVLSAVAAKDEAALKALLVTREEYETLLWPEMPDKDYTPFEFVWSLAQTNSRKGIRQVLSSYGGLRLELVSVEFPEDPEVYESFTMRPGARVVVRRPDTGEEGVLPTFDVFVEYGGGWKLLNYDEL
jgi:hypothetical protein